MVDLKEFVRNFTHQRVFNHSDVVRIYREFYLVPKKLRSLMDKKTLRPVFAGTLLAAERGQTLRPSTQLLDLLAQTDAKRVVLNKEAEWLCICGRTPLLSSVIKKDDGIEKGDTVLLMNETGETIGYGMIRDDWEKKNGTIKLQYDIGDFLRRERHVMQKPEKQRNARQS